MEEKIELPSIDLPEQKVVESKHHYLLITDEWIEYMYDFIASEPELDEDGNKKEFGVWENKRRLFNWQIMRKCLVGVDLQITTNPSRWKVYLLCRDSEPWTFHLLKRSEAEAIRDRIKVLIKQYHNI